MAQTEPPRTREPDVYGCTTLDEINQQISELSKELGLDAETFQSNSEGAIVDAIQNKTYNLLIIKSCCLYPYEHCHQGCHFRCGQACH